MGTPAAAPRVVEHVERVDGRVLRYSDFVERYLRENRPVLLTGLMDDWPACDEWVTGEGRPDLRFFSDHFQDSIVQVADCNSREFTDQKRTEMSVSAFICNWLKSFHSSEKFEGSSCCDQQLLYLKDWHFVKEYPEYIAYTTPSFFRDDWLNLYLDSHCLHRDSDIRTNKNEVNCADYRFVYIGMKGTWTPLHVDVFKSYSWSANICGKKLWYLLPPSQCHLVYDRNLKMSIYDVHDVSDSQFPNFYMSDWWQCIQERNEIIFIPSGWYHQVHNLEDTISINHNWFNACNLSCVWNLLLNDYNEAVEYIDDIRQICDNFESLCQRNLAANTGMNFYDFFILITRFTLASLILLSSKRKSSDACSTSWNKDHQLVSNIAAACRVISCMKSHESFSEENLSSCSMENQNALSKVGNIASDPDFINLCHAMKETYDALAGFHEQNPEASNMNACGEDSSLNNMDLDCVDYDFSISCPEDLLKLIQHSLEGHSH